CTMDVLLAHATEDPPLFAKLGLADMIPEAIENVVRACLAKYPDQRPANARDLAERYETALFHEQALREAPLAAAPQSSPSGEGSQAFSTPPPAMSPLSGYDANTLVHQLEAWMPEKIASYKLRGFVQDSGGEVMECVPGRIRVRLGGRGSVYAPPG